MNRTFLIQLAVVSTAIALVGPALAAPPAAAPSPARATQPEPTVPAEQAPVAAQSSNLLCGLTPADVSDIVDHYGFISNGLASALATPFDCDAYGDLCSALSEQQAHAYACSVWQDLKAHESIQSTQASSMQKLNQWVTSCTPDQWACKEGCQPYGVIMCAGRYYNGNCWSVAMCDQTIRFPVEFFDFIDYI